MNKLLDVLKGVRYFEVNNVWRVPTTKLQTLLCGIAGESFYCTDHEDDLRVLKVLR